MSVVSPLVFPYLTAAREQTWYLTCQYMCKLCLLPCCMCTFPTATVAKWKTWTCFCRGLLGDVRPTRLTPNAIFSCLSHFKSLTFPCAKQPVRLMPETELERQCYRSNVNGFMSRCQTVIICKGIIF